MKQTFEEYLMERCALETHALDDMLPDVFNDWIGDIDPNQLIDFANIWGNTIKHGAIKQLVDGASEHTHVENDDKQTFTIDCFGIRNKLMAIWDILRFSHMTFTPQSMEVTKGHIDNIFKALNK